MIRGVLFDMDGVLVDTENLGSRVMMQVARELGYHLTLDTYLLLLGRNREANRQILCRVFGDSFPYRELERRCTAGMCEVARTGKLPVKKGVLECMEGLRRRGIPRALATGSERVVADTYIQHTPALQNCFDAIVCGMEVLHGKPEPDIYQIAAGKLGLAPTECMGVEDSYNGVRSLRAAGCLSVMVPDLAPYGPDFAPYVDAHLNDLTELCALLDQTNQQP